MNQMPRTDLLEQNQTSTSRSVSTIFRLPRDGTNVSIPLPASPRDIVPYDVALEYHHKKGRISGTEAVCGLVDLHYTGRAETLPEVRNTFIDLIKCNKESDDVKEAAQQFLLSSSDMLDGKRGFLRDMQSIYADTQDTFLSEVMALNDFLLHGDRAQERDIKGSWVKDSRLSRKILENFFYDVEHPLSVVLAYRLRETNVPNERQRRRDFLRNALRLSPAGSWTVAERLAKSNPTALHLQIVALDPSNDDDASLLKEIAITRVTGEEDLESSLFRGHTPAMTASLVLKEKEYTEQY